MRFVFPLSLVVLSSLAFGQSQPDYLPESRFHLTARPWAPINAPKSQLLDRVATIIHQLAPLQHWNPSDANDAKNGAIIDPYNGVEVQYATPYFSYAVATALSQERASDLIEQGIRALDHATADINGLDGTPKANDNHGEFFVAPMMKALRLYESMQKQGRFPGQLTPELIRKWKDRMTVSRTKFMNLGVLQNWRTYGMKGEWLRHQDGLISDGVKWIEANWTEKKESEQRERFSRDGGKYGLNPSFGMYHDDTGDPQNFAYNGGAAGNLLDMLENGYNGPSAAEMRKLITHNVTSELFLMGGSGEAPAGGRTGNHVWNDIVYGNNFEMMAEVTHRKGDARLAGQFRRAAQLAFQSAFRFQQEKGWFSVTKSLLHPSLKNHYAKWSALTNYNGYTEIHLSEAFATRKTNIPELPTPSEIGGYAVTLDPEFANTFLNAGGMQTQICTRGETDNYGDVQWHTLGIVRFSRAAWDSRLGPGDGYTSSDFSEGASFSPVFLENGAWTRVSQQPKRFQGSFKAEFVHPLLVRGVYTIAPRAGEKGPAFAMNVTLMPDGALVDTARTSGTEAFGVIWPLLEYDGRTVLMKNVGAQIASTAFPRMIGKSASLPAPKLTETNAVIEWKDLNGGDGGATTIGFRYALEGDKSTTRVAKLLVNGTPQPDLIFASTGKWDDWHQLYVPVTLAAGKGNSIRIEFADEESAHIDELRVFPAVASAREPDQQNFIALKDTHQTDASANPARGGYGDLRPVRVTDSKGATVETFVYPRSAGDPGAEEVRKSFKRDGADFSSVLGRVKGNLYSGRTSAGGKGDAIDLNGDGTDDVTFSKPCQFILQLANGKVTAVEADSEVTATVQGRKLNLQPFSPVTL